MHCHRIDSSVREAKLLLAEWQSARNALRRAEGVATFSRIVKLKEAEYAAWCRLPWVSRERGQ